MGRPTQKELAGRVRAARAYARGKQTELAAVLNVSVETMSRIEKGSRPLSDPELEKVIAHYPEVPEWFFDRGWDGPAVSENGSSDAVTADLQRQIEDVRRSLALFRRDVARQQRDAGKPLSETVDLGGPAGGDEG